MSLIQCNKVSKHYGTKLALDNVSFTIEPGAPVALVGPNGAGKTTLFSLLCGYIRPSEGEISLFGQRPGSRSLLNKIAALPQDARLDPNLSVEQQLTFFAQLQGFNKAQAVMESLRVLRLVDLEASAAQKPSALSHGMSKRVSIAQALIGSPQLILLDEPTAGLDPANAKAIRELVRALSGQITFVISSHNLNELEKLCDKVLYLDQGQLSQSVSIKNDQLDDYLTLTMHHCDSKQLLATLEAWPEVQSVKSDQYSEFVIRYERLPEYQFEQKLLELFNQQQWLYKSMQRGRSLEDKLFAAQ
ncbi:ABC transporter ATP-binding protein [Shewanella sp. AS1]|uniref:ABC transporter ATP-binding protein n=1 Tax=Shewanella sp. AS1 TaxID=2907626 RepID=UPI001F3B4953|nr:ABC transporter ATP-binding protein [Shewanella sp. AS1]MCE9678375.1 ABC transporter ATP-binding protein [Shewanella sp. AS1]